ncbi:MAG: SAM-dependent DNA methyltransferase [Bacteroidales bacterium]|nr:SAM-dependent DNA methyltransferase [Bacteroidales bacterium]
MSIDAKQQQTTVNVQEKANLIWAIADILVGVYKPHEYGNVILPMCVIKRFEDTLAPTREKVLETNKELDEKKIEMKRGFLERAAGQKFYNLSRFTFETLLADADNIKDNFESYLNHFSENVIDIIHRMEFQKEIDKMADNGLLYLVIKEFCTTKAYLGADKVSSVDMGYIFEELVRKFSESYDEQAGAHFTARDIINLMAELLIGDDEARLEEEGIIATDYDMTMGTSQMLSCLHDRFKQIDPDAEITSYGQELNNQTFAIAKADTLIRGGNADNMRQGDTLGDDQFSGYKFDYIISNPPFGIEWKPSRQKVEEEFKLGGAGRFEPGLPSIGDGQMLFLLNGVAKLKDEGRMAIIQNGSSLFKGDAGSGESNIRGYLLDHDWLEAIVQLPTDLFYNTGIATYVWVVTKNKSAERQGKVQLIDASQCSEKRRKPLGNKRVEISDYCRDLIMQAYHGFNDFVYKGTTPDGEEVQVESRVKDNDDFKYRKIFIDRPLRLVYENPQMPGNDVKLSEADRMTLQLFIDGYRMYYNGQRMIDRDFFQKVKFKAGLKVTKAQVKKIRQYLGTKDETVEEVYEDPFNLSKRTYVWDADLADTEIIPWKEDQDSYLARNVAPYAPDYHVDEEKTRIGYEIPFTCEFYRYTPLKPSSEIFQTLKDLEQKESELMESLLH